VSSEIYVLILYKYVSLKAARKIALSGRISFTATDQFNDPYEMHAISNFSGKHEHSDPTMLNVDYSLVKAYLQCHGVLSLTRNPLNNLMWSHYGDEHKGVVLGIDVEEAGFCCKETTLVPANLGEIIYTKTFPERMSPAELQSLHSITAQKKFCWEFYEFYKFAYLFKGLEWSYEEEVRVVKYTGMPVYDEKDESNNQYVNSNGDWRHIRQDDGKEYNLYKFPISSVKELIIGMSFMRGSTAKEMDEVVNLFSKETDVKCCGMGWNTYAISTNKWK